MIITNFSQVMRDWRRLCDKMDEGYEVDACLHCPLTLADATQRGCDAIYTDWAENVDWDKIASVVEDWAAKNPEPKYPTWIEWLKQMDIVTFTLGDFPEDPGKVLTAKHLFDPIPANIAEKLGLKPKGENENG